MKDSASDYTDYIDRTQPKANQYMLSLPTWDLTDPTKADSTLSFGYDEKVELLETLDVVERLELSLRLQRERLTEMEVRKQIRDDVRSGAENQQREYFLRKQMDSIRKELGDDDGSVIDEYRRKIEEAGMPASAIFVRYSSITEPSSSPSSLRIESICLRRKYSRCCLSAPLFTSSRIRLRTCISPSRSR